jgi:squalene-hopene/tetraprenyl-beta-curcumene cyclase
MHTRTFRSGNRGWPPRLFPGRLNEGARRLRKRLVGRVEHCGAVREPCRSRVLETALMLRLLERTALRPQWQRLRDYLERHRESNDSLDRLLVAAALGSTKKPELIFIDRCVALAPQFTSHRKRALLAAIFALFGTEPSFTVVDNSAFSTIGMHSWAAVQVTAAKVILATMARIPQNLCEQDIALLISTQLRPHVWEGNILIHLSVLHALAGIPDCDRLVNEGIEKALEHQREDGGMPFISDADTWCTATAGVALGAAGVPREELYRIADYLVSQQRPNGGWSFSELADLTDVDDISVSLELLQTLDPVKYRIAIARGLERLYSLQNIDGGFPTYLAGAPSEACMTAAAVNALSVQPNQHAKILADGLNFIATAQKPDGTFGPDWSASRFHTIFRVILATTCLRRRVPARWRAITQRAVAAVREAQNPDGGWGQQKGDPSDAISTSYALVALCYEDDPHPLVRGVDFLLGAQRDDGRIDSIPDSIGPRPFIFSLPVLTDTFALLAFGHLTSVMERPGEDVFDALAGGEVSISRQIPCHHVD